MVMIEYWLSDEVILCDLISVNDSNKSLSWRAEIMIKKSDQVVDEYILTPDKPQTLSEMVNHILQELVRHKGVGAIDVGFRAWHAE